MPSYGKYYIGIRLLLLKAYLEANAEKIIVDRSNNSSTLRLTIRL